MINAAVTPRYVHKDEQLADGFQWQHSGSGPVTWGPRTKAGCPLLSGTVRSDLKWSLGYFLLCLTTHCQFYLLCNVCPFLPLDPR